MLAVLCILVAATRSTPEKWISNLPKRLHAKLLVGFVPACLCIEANKKPRALRDASDMMLYSLLHTLLHLDLHTRTLPHLFPVDNRRLVQVGIVDDKGVEILKRQRSVSEVNKCGMLSAFAGDILRGKGELHDESANLCMGLATHKGSHKYLLQLTRGEGDFCEKSRHTFLDQLT